jgi:hypothetical protein
MHHDGDGDEASTSHSNDNAPCPFSLVASATPVEIPHLQAGASGLTDETFAYLSAPTFRVGPVRAQFIRGPPAFA